MVYEKKCFKCLGVCFSTFAWKEMFEFPSILFQDRADAVFMVCGVFCTVEKLVLEQL